MNVTEIERTLLDMPTAALRRVLIHLIDEVTIEARETYAADGSVAAPDQLREFNEAIHRLAAALRHCDEGKSATAVEMVSAQIGDEDPMARAIGRAMKRSLAMAESHETRQSFRSAS